MTRVALPVFRDRVSPVLDSCERLLIVDIEQEDEVDRKEIYINRLALTERLKLLRELNVSKVICGGVSETLFRMLESCQIEAIVGIAGGIEDVVCAFCQKTLNDPKYCMPGYRFPREAASE
jgi:predicted Fe-Mo cluster-binding NifX family protein